MKGLFPEKKLVFIGNKTGLQSVSRPVNQVPLLRGWVQSPVGATAKHTDRQDTPVAGVCKVPLVPRLSKVRQTDKTGGASVSTAVR